LPTPDRRVRLIGAYCISISLKTSHLHSLIFARAQKISLVV